MSKKIPLQNGMFAIVDEEDYERIKEYSCYVINKETFLSVVLSKGGNKNSLAKYIFNYNKDEAWIPINGNYLDLTKRNAKIVDKKSRNRYMKARRNSKSKYKGVTWQAGKWVAQINDNGVHLYLGRYEKEEDAALAYNKTAYLMWGDECYLNLIGKDNRIGEYEEWTKEGKRHTGVNTKHGYRGIHYLADKRKFRFRIYRKGKPDVTSKLFSNPIQAAKAYDKKAYELHGDKAILNFLELIEEYKKTLA